MYKVDSRWLKIYYTVDDKPYFNYHGRRIHMDAIVRTHNNPWVSDIYPEYIHGFEADEYYDPLYIRVNDDGTAVKVYKKM